MAFVDAIGAGFDYAVKGVNYHFAPIDLDDAGRMISKHAAKTRASLVQILTEQQADITVKVNYLQEHARVSSQLAFLSEYGKTCEGVVDIVYTSAKKSLSELTLQDVGSWGAITLFTLTQQLLGNKDIVPNASAEK